MDERYLIVVLSWVLNGRVFLNKDFSFVDERVLIVVLSAVQLLISLQQHHLVWNIFFHVYLPCHLWSKRFCESYNVCLYVINDTLYVRMLSVIQCIFVYYRRYNVCLYVINDTMYVRMLSIKAKNFNSRIKHFVFNSISLEKAFISNCLKLSHFWTAELLPYQ